MLTGLLRPTAGRCSVMGHDVHSAAAHARQHIGYCPQANVLFGSLTVWEHLLLFCAIKGLSSGAFGPAATAASHDIMQARLLCQPGTHSIIIWSSVHCILCIVALSDDKEGPLPVLLL